jgi:ABC-type multidrug transport system ATPase subunit
MAEPSAPALLLDNVVKSYGSVRAVDGVSLAAKPGEFIALLGPNGAGKTTLFQLLSGLFAADSGRIEVMGHDMARDPVPALARLCQQAEALTAVASERTELSLSPVARRLRRVRAPARPS